MKSNNELKEINIKNRACYHFVDTINSNDLHVYIIFQMKKHIRNFSRKTENGAKPLCIIFGKTDSYIRKHDQTKHLGVILCGEMHEKTFDKIKYLVILKRDISAFINTRK